jgi:CHAD domain-containing protein
MTPTRQTSTSGRRKASAAGLDCANAFQQIALGCVADIKAQHSSACAGDADAVYQIRVAITRLRAAVAFFGPIVIDAEWLRLKEEIAWLNVVLGAARDSYVVVEYAHRKRFGVWAQGKMGASLDRRQMQDHRRLVRSLRSARFAHMVSALVRWIKRGSWLRHRERRKDAESLESYCEHRFDGWRRRLIRKGRHLKTLKASRRHRLRIKVKRFRYMLEALSEAVRGGGLKHLHGPARRLQRALGDLRDLKRFAARAGRSVSADSSGRKSPPGYRRRREKLLSAAIEAYRGFKRVGNR